MVILIPILQEPSVSPEEKIAHNQLVLCTVQDLLHQKIVMIQLDLVLQFILEQLEPNMPHRLSVLLVRLLKHKLVKQPDRGMGHIHMTVVLQQLIILWVQIVIRMLVVPGVEHGLMPVQAHVLGLFPQLLILWVQHVTAITMIVAKEIQAHIRMPALVIVVCLQPHQPIPLIMVKHVLERHQQRIIMEQRIQAALALSAVRGIIQRPIVVVQLEVLPPMSQE